MFIQEVQIYPLANQDLEVWDHQTKHHTKNPLQENQENESLRIIRITYWLNLHSRKPNLMPLSQKFLQIFVFYKFPAYAGWQGRHLPDVYYQGWAAPGTGDSAHAVWAQTLLSLFGEFTGGWVALFILAP